ncbi:MAG: hypothetical protein HN732_11275, partial [Rhodospirillaceae bacterium]|nr:hypothetical protein [Rhodospirillaceae bacterium]
QPLTYGPATSHAVSASGTPQPTKVVTADFNSDDETDVAVLNKGAQTFSILENQRVLLESTFKSPVETSIGTDASDMTTGDMDGDGHEDIVISTEDGRVLTYKGNGDNTFQAATATNVGSGRIGGLTVANFDGDDDLDVMVTNPDDHTVSVLLNDGSGNLSVDQKFATHGSPDAIAALENSSGTFAHAVVAHPDLNIASTLRALGSVAPFIGPPNSNIVFGFTDTLLNAGDTFTIGDKTLTVGVEIDVNDPDVLALAGNVRSFLTDQIAVSRAFGGLAVTEGSYTGNLSVTNSFYNGTGFGTQTTVSNIRMLIPGTGFSNGDTFTIGGVTLTAGTDFTIGNGLIADTQAFVGAVTGSSLNEGTFSGSVSGSFYAEGNNTIVHFEEPGAAANDLTVSTNISGAVILDNNDGSDLNPNIKGSIVISPSTPGETGNDLTASVTSASAVLIQDSNGFSTSIPLYSSPGFTTSPNHPNSSNSYTHGIGAGAGAITAADFNNDGLMDIAIANETDDTVSISLRNPNGYGGAFNSTTTVSVGDAPKGVAAGDFNGDGITDIATSNSGDNTVSFLMGNGDGTFQTAVSNAVGTGPGGIAVGDFDGDGIDGVVTVNATSHDLSRLEAVRDDFGSQIDTLGNSVRFKKHPTGSGDLGLGSIDVVSGASSAVTAIDNAIERLGRYLSEWGAGAKRLEIQEEFVSKLITTFKGAIGAMVDADLAEEMAKQQREQIKQQLGTQALSIANSNPQMVLTLFS